MGKVVLFLPPYSGPVLGPPAGLLCLATPLLRAGHRVKIVDGALTPDYLPALERELAEATCLGVSLLTGPMIRHALKAAEWVKAFRPDLPVVFGGWHPSLLPDQTLAEPSVDAVVRHQGEITFLEIVERLVSGEDLAGVLGCSFKSKDSRIHNPDRPVAHVGTFPPPAYDLVDFDGYERAGGGRKLPYAASVGCPYACNYCTDTVFYQRKFNAHSAARVVEDVTGLVARHRLNEVALLDSNFLVDTKRAMEIARGFLASGVRFTWTFQASTDLLCRLTDEEVRILGRSGVGHIGFGVESGAPEVLRLMEKRHQNTADMTEAARKCSLAGIRATFNLIFGFPGETEREREKTACLMGEIGSRFRDVTFSPNMFTPYPGLPVWPELKKRGLREPDSMLGWSRFVLGHHPLPWLNGAEYRKVRRTIAFFILNNAIAKAGRSHNLPPARRSLLYALRRPLRWRLKHGFFGWPVELWLGKRASSPLSLLTGQVLNPSLEDPC